MNIYFTLKRLLLWATLPVFISSCNTERLPVAPVVETESRLIIKNAPDWVNNGSGFVRDKGERLIQGVAHSPVVGDLAQQKAIADDLARAEVERLLSTYLVAISGKYSGSVYAVTSGVQEAGARELAAHSQVQPAASLCMSRARIAKSWRDPRNNAVWSLALLDITQVRNIADGQNEGNRDFLRFLETEADNVFDSFINQKQ